MALRVNILEQEKTKAKKENAELWERISKLEKENEKQAENNWKLYEGGKINCCVNMYSEFSMHTPNVNSQDVS